MPRTAVLWFRRDLRLHDLPALHEAIGGLRPDRPALCRRPGPRGGSLGQREPDWFLAQALAELAGGLAERGAGLAILRGDPRLVVPAIAREVGASAVVVSRDFGPYGRARDDAIAVALDGHGIRFRQASGQLVHEPEDIRRDGTDGSGYYSVFSPFHRRWRDLPRRAVLEAPARIPAGPIPAAARAVVADVLGDPHPIRRPCAAACARRGRRPGPARALGHVGRSR